MKCSICGEKHPTDQHGRARYFEQTQRLIRRLEALDWSVLGSETAWKVLPVWQWDEVEDILADITCLEQTGEIR